ncbi:hypothetical protein NLC29_03520, partial [Candidatus Aminicenantes bacterium AH-873-B07]|nr:hypothetical protein [Candidatus Aminicenantes bacterium AH-873-B07]
WIYHGLRNLLPQGRYLFPAILPISLVFIFGIKNLFDLFHRKGGVIALWFFLIFEFIFFNFSLWNYILPVFHMIIKSPYPGI